jgi:hypothetical protein
LKTIMYLPNQNLTVGLSFEIIAILIFFAI